MGRNNGKNAKRRSLLKFVSQIDTIAAANADKNFDIEFILVKEEKEQNKCTKWNAKKRMSGMRGEKWKEKMYTYGKVQLRID